jgi:hypothetical protein
VTRIYVISDSAATSEAIIDLSLKYVFNGHHLKTYDASQAEVAACTRPLSWLNPLLK